MFKTKSNYKLEDVDNRRGQIKCYVSIFDNIDSDNDMIVKGAFARTIKERGPNSNRLVIKHLWQHDPWSPIGLPKEMQENEKGLYVVSEFGTDKESQEKFQKHVDGIIDQFSIGYNTIISEKGISQGKEYNVLKELKLWEYSSVTWGANSETFIEDIKSSDKETLLEKTNRRIDALKKGLRSGIYRDETLESFELELEQLKSIYNSLINRPGKNPSDDKRGENHSEVEELLKTFKKQTDGFKRSKTVN